MKQLVFVLLFFFLNSVSAIELKNKTINVVIPFPPGGGVDLTFQNLKKYAESKNIKLVAKYKSGAEGLIGMIEISNMPNDGLNVGIVTTGTIATYWKKKNDISLIPLTGIRNSISGLIVNSGSNIRTFDQYKIALADNSNFSIGVGAPGQKMLVDQLLSILKIENRTLIVPYKGGLAVLSDLQGGHISTAILPLNIIAKHIDNGSIRLIALNADKTPKNYNALLLKDVLVGWKDVDWYHFILPSNTSKEIKEAWLNFLQEYSSDKEVQKSFVDDFTETVPFGESAALDNVKIFFEKM